MANGNGSNGGELRSVAEIQRDVDAMFANLGDAEYQITQQTERKGQLLARMRELGAEMHMARKVAAAQAKAASPAPPGPYVEVPVPAAAVATPVASRAEDLKRAVENSGLGKALAEVAPVETVT